MEPHCAVAEWRGEDLTIWSSTQAIYEGRAELARAFGIPAERVRVICEFMGGGFGSKFGVGPEGISRRRSPSAAGTPSGWSTPPRGEPDGRVPDRGPRELRVGRRRDGTLRGIEASVVMGLGSDGWTYPILEPMKAVYKCDNVRGFVLPVAQNLGPTAAFRAPGVMEGTFGSRSRSTSSPTRSASIRWSCRRTNYVEVDQQAGMPYSSKNLLDCYDRAAELAGWADRDAPAQRRIASAAAWGWRRQIWWGGGGPPAYAEVRIGHDGACHAVEIGVQDIGTGVTTAFAMIAAERLGVRSTGVARAGRRHDAGRARARRPAGR